MEWYEIVMAIPVIIIGIYISIKLKESRKNICNSHISKNLNK